jgi:hypothetical protein
MARSANDLERGIAALEAEMRAFELRVTCLDAQRTWRIAPNLDALEIENERARMRRKLRDLQNKRKQLEKTVKVQRGHYANATA